MTHSLSRFIAVRKEAEASCGSRSVRLPPHIWAGQEQEVELGLGPSLQRLTSSDVVPPPKSPIISQNMPPWSNSQASGGHSHPNQNGHCLPHSVYDLCPWSFAMATCIPRHWASAYDPCLGKQPQLPPTLPYEANVSEIARGDSEFRLVHTWLGW